MLFVTSSIFFFSYQSLIVFGAQVFCHFVYIYSWVFYSFLKTFIYLFMIVLGLSCGLWDLVLQCAGFFSLIVPHRLHSTPAPGFVACRLSLTHPHLTVVVLACGILVPPPEIKPMSPALAGGFLTTGPPGSPERGWIFVTCFFCI